MTTVELLRKAREVVAAPGVWTQKPSDGEVCMFIATQRATSRCTMPTTDAEDYADRLLLKAIGVVGICAGFRWNDAPRRTLEEVLAAYDRAIVLAEAEAR